MWFPVSIYRKDNLLAEDYNEKLKKHCNEIRARVPTGGSDWYGGTYNTHGTHDVNKDSKFAELLELITHHVNEFAKQHNSTATYKPYYAWVNMSEKGAWQEFHTHNDAIFSAVYYIAAPEGSGKIVFEDPKEPDMLPLKGILEKNVLSYTRISYGATEGTLLIFRSYLRHMVEPGTFEGTRISLAVNFT